MYTIVLHHCWLGNRKKVQFVKQMMLMQSLKVYVGQP